jgi:hypothetical protein
MDDKQAVKLAESLWDEWDLGEELTEEQKAIVFLWKRSNAYKWATRHPVQALAIHKLH